jgi:Ras-related protein Rab-18
MMVEDEVDHTFKVCRLYHSNLSFVVTSKPFSLTAPPLPFFPFKKQILLVGDSGVGKSSLLLRFATGGFEEMAPTIGVDFKAKVIQLNNKKVKLTIWDTAGQERFRTLTSSYYRGAQGIIFVYDVSRRETFESLTDIWMKEVDMYSTIDDCAKMVVANKTDLPAELREVTREEGARLARQHGCLFVETSAKGNVAVQQAFDELVLRILDTPSLLAGTSSAFGLKPNVEQRSTCC